MRKLALLVASASVVSCLGTASSWANGNTWYVDPEYGTDATGCGGESIALGVTNEPVGSSPPTAGPCQTLNKALSNAASGDNIIIERGGVFGPILLTGAISIIGPADHSAIIEWVASTQAGCIGGAPGSCTGINSDSSATPLYAVDVQGGPSNTVKFKNLLISNGAGTNGAVFIGNNFGVAFKNVAIRGGSGTIPEMVYAAPTALNSSGNPVQLYFANCDIAFSSSGGGVYVEPSVAMSVLFQGGEVHNGLFGVKLDGTNLTSGTIAGAVDNTEFFSFSNSAVTAKATNTGFVHLLLSRSAIVNTGSTAFNISGANAVGVLYEDTITGNAIGVGVSGGTAFGFGNSEIFGNTTNVSGTITEETLQ